MSCRGVWQWYLVLLVFMRISRSLSWRPDFSPFKTSLPNVVASQWSELEALAAKLYEWNSKINLVSRQDVDRLVENHIMPSLAVSKVRPFAPGERVIDVGTGGGLPGLPLAIVNPEATFTLLDSNTKKMMVVEDLVAYLGLENRVKVVKGRAETHTERYDFILGRAVSAIPNFLSFSAHLLGNNAGPGTRPVGEGGAAISSGLLYLKGGDFGEELKEAGITQSRLFPVQELLPSIVSDKSVLYVDSEQIAAFRSRMHAASAATAPKPKPKPSLSTARSRGSDKDKDKGSPARN
jgi:16S rRNA (guanine527-N7)-methyltransferase